MAQFFPFYKNQCQIYSVRFINEGRSEELASFVQLKFISVTLCRGKDLQREVLENSEVMFELAMLSLKTLKEPSVAAKLYKPVYIKS